MNRFEVITNRTSDLGKYGIFDNECKDDGDGILTTVERQVSARVIVDKLNELQRTIDEKPLDLHTDIQDYEDRLNWLKKTSKRLIEIEEIYKEEFKIELAQAIEEGIDFKKIYGGNTEKTRKQYVDEQLQNLLDEKRELKQYKEDDLRRIELLKRVIDIKTKLMGL